MCGLIAAFTEEYFPDRSARAALTRMSNRGPDGQDEWREPGVYLGHRRLAILDLDVRSSQPMSSICSRYVVVFNGEIYNYRELRGELAGQGTVFRTTSDTEVILALFAREGEAMLRRLRGMFSFVIWDREAQRAFAARDPYGIKPLYVASISGGVLLSSQVKALLATGLVSRSPDPVGQAGYWMLGSVPEPHTWYLDIKAVPAGHCLWIESGKVSGQRRWQDIGNAWTAESDQGTAASLSVREVHHLVRLAIRESVSRHLVADVPIGVFLSGGIDSGALAALMVEAGVRNLQGITIAYDEFAGHAEDETPGAARLASEYGIHHHVRRVSREEFVADLPNILDAMDQPSIDGVNTWYASKAVAECGIKVVISGVGGDELFLGYESFRQLPRLVAAWKQLAKLPGAMAMAGLLVRANARTTGNNRWRHAPEWARTISGAWWLRRSVGAPEDVPHFMDIALARQGLHGFTADAWIGEMAGALPPRAVLALAKIESATYLRNQLLRDSDWASMGHSVELRTPLVDSHLLEQLRPVVSRFPEFSNKCLLADAPQKRLPQSITNKTKTGFGIPVRRWMHEAGMGDQGHGWQGWMKAVADSYDAH